MTLLKISIKDIEPALRTIANFYSGSLMPTDEQVSKVRDREGSWIEGVHLTSRKLREIFFGKSQANPKITIIKEEVKAKYYANLSKIIGVNNKSRMLRLLYGDVYCAERLVHFNLSDSDRCRRCLEKETIMHLLVECPYTKATH